MTPLISRLISAVRADCRPIDECLVCGDPVYPDDRVMRVLGGGYVHSGCSTYRMRQRQRVRRSLGAEHSGPNHRAPAPVAAE